MSTRVEKGKRWFKFVLLMVGITAGIKGLFALGHPSAANKLAEALVQFIGGAIIFGGLAFVLGWLAGKDDLSRSDSASSAGMSEIPLRKAPSSPGPESLQENGFDEDAAYSQALKELESSSVEQAIWSRAFAEADGVDAKARALYIKLRVERMRKAT